MFARFQTVEASPLIQENTPSPQTIPSSGATSYNNWQPDTPQEINAYPPNVVPIDPYPYTPHPPPVDPVHGVHAYATSDITPPYISPARSHFDRSRPVINAPMDTRQYDRAHAAYPPPPPSEYFRMPHPPPQPYQPMPPPYPENRRAPWMQNAPQDPSPLNPSPKRNAEAGPSSSRPMLQPPPGVDGCIWCHTRSSPEWRRSDSGVKNMCNA